MLPLTFRAPGLSNQPIILFRYVYTYCLSLLQLNPLCLLSCILQYFPLRFLCQHKCSHGTPVENKNVKHERALLSVGRGCFSLVRYRQSGEGKGRGGEERRGYKPAEHPANTSENRNTTLYSFALMRCKRPLLHRMARCLISRALPTLQFIKSFCCCCIVHRLCRSLPPVDLCVYVWTHVGGTSGMGNPQRRRRSLMCRCSQIERAHTKYAQDGL